MCENGNQFVLCDVTKGAGTSPSSSQPGVASSDPVVPSKSCFFFTGSKSQVLLSGDFCDLSFFLSFFFYSKSFIYFPFAERKCGLFSPSLSSLVLSKPCPSAWRLLPPVKQPAVSIIHSTFTPASVRLVQQKRTRAPLCLCDLQVWAVRVWVQHVRGRTEVLFQRGPLRAVSLLCECRQTVFTWNSLYMLHRVLTLQFSPSGGSSVLRACRRVVPHTQMQPPGPAEGRVLSHLPQSVLKRPRRMRFALRLPLFVKLKAAKSRLSPSSPSSVSADCEFEQEVHADGKAFVPAGSGPCLKCRCKASQVLEEESPH